MGEALEDLVSCPERDLARKRQSAHVKPLDVAYSWCAGCYVGKTLYRENPNPNPNSGCTLGSEATSDYTLDKKQT